MSCKEKEKSDITYPYDRETIPSVKTHNDTMLISDSGLIKYKVIAKTSLIFNDAVEPYYFFPDGAYMEKYDSLQSIVTTIVADTVWNYNRKYLWKLKGNVKINNVEGKRYTSEELFWDERADRLYSNVYVVIEEDNKMTMRAYGFEANQRMTKYVFTDAENVDLYVSEESSENEAKKDTINKKIE